MPRYMVQASYTAAAAAAFASNPQDRTGPVKALIEKCGGTLDSMEFCLGEFDLVAMATLADDVTAAAVALAANAPGHLKAYRTTRLMSSEEFVAAQRKAHGVSLAAPSKG